MPGPFFCPGPALLPGLCGEANLDLPYLDPVLQKFMNFCNSSLQSFEDSVQCPWLLAQFSKKSCSFISSNINPKWD